VYEEISAKEYDPTIESGARTSSILDSDIHSHVGFWESDTEEGVIQTGPTQEEEWRWLYDAGWRAAPDSGVGSNEPGVWYGAMRLDLSHEIGHHITDVAYYDHEDAAHYAQPYVGEDDGGAPTEDWIPAEQHEPEGAGWVELELNEPLLVEEPGDYWVVVEFNDYGDNFFPFGVISPHVDDGGLLSMDDPHTPDDWEVLPDHGLGYSWSLEVRVVEKSFDLTIDTYGEGTTEPEPGIYTHDSGEEVTIETIPEEGYRFNNWLGDYPYFEKYEDEITITMDSNKEITAYFIEEDKRKWVVESQKGWEHETDEQDDLIVIEEGVLKLIEPPEILEVDHEVGVYEAGIGWLLDKEVGYHEIAYDTSSHTDWDDYQWILDSTDPEFEPLDPLTDFPQFYLEGLTSNTDYYFRVRSHTLQDEIYSTSDEYNFETGDPGGGCLYGHSSREIEPLLFRDENPRSMGSLRDGREGFWISDMWYSGLEERSRVNIFETHTEIGSDESVQFRLGVDETEDGEVDQWTDWLVLVDGENVFTENDLELPGGYGYKVEYELSTEVDNSPKILDHGLEIEEVEEADFTLEIDAEGEGLVKVEGDEVDLPYEEVFMHGEEIALEAIPDENYNFVEWTGDVGTVEDPMSNSTSVIMEDDCSITAVFALDTYVLSVDSTVGGEVVRPGEGSFEYEHGEVVDLEAEADEDHRFVRWTGDNSTIDDLGSRETFIQILDNYTITAVFEEIEEEYYELIIDVDGEGDVEIDPDEDEYIEGTEVTLTAIPEDDWKFIEWTGDHVDTEEVITITMDDHKEITAHFEEDVKYLELDVNIEGEGDVELDPDQDDYEEGTEVTLSATPAEGWYFVEWTGDYENTEEEITLVMYEDKEITAHFEEDIKYFELEVGIEGEGEVLVDPDEEVYLDGTEVELTAVPEEGWLFVEWTGDVESSEEEITVVMNDHKEITAHFLMDAYFDIEILSPEDGSEYVEGDEVLVEYTVTNIGDIEDTQTISFTVHDEDGELVFDDQDRVTIGTLLWEDVYQGEFVWEVEDGLVGEFTLTISNENEEKEVTITISEKVVIYELNVEVEGEGTVALEPDQDGFEEGTEVTLTAVPEEGHGFVEWTGDYEGTEEEIDIVMDSDKSITAVFEEVQLSLEIVSPHDGDIFNDSTITVEWASENAAHHEVRLNEEDRIDVGQETSYTFEELESGEHTVEVRAVLGTFSVEESVNIIVDTVIPHLEITYPEAGEEFKEREVTVGWDSSDDISGISYFEVRIEGRDWIEVGLSDHTFEDLEVGEHTVEVRAWDNAGNHASEEVTFTIEAEDEDEPSFFDRFCSLWWILLLIVLVVVVALFVYKRREEEEDEGGFLDEMEGLEDRDEESSGSEEEMDESEEDEEEPEPLEESSGSELEEESDIEGEDTVEDVVSHEEYLEKEEEKEIAEPEVEKDEKEKIILDDELFFECRKCGFLVTADEKECPYCETSLKKEED